LPDFSVGLRRVSPSRARRCAVCTNRSSTASAIGEVSGVTPIVDLHYFFSGTRGTGGTTQDFGVIRWYRRVGPGVPMSAGFVLQGQSVMVVPPVPPCSTTMISMTCLQYPGYHRSPARDDHPLTATSITAIRLRRGACAASGERSGARSGLRAVGPVEQFAPAGCLRAAQAPDMPY
jgi:hypothetical protein